MQMQSLRLNSSTHNPPVKTFSALFSVFAIQTDQNSQDRYQREFGLLHRFGLQSNVICVASFSNVEEKTTLSRAVLYPALRKVIRKYPELGMVYFLRESTQKSSQHRSFLGVLPQINLDRHVEFIEIPTEEEQDGLTATIERYHGLWFDKSAEPPWKLVIVNNKHALLVFDHFITDGKGSTFIFESLLQALNTSDEQNSDSPIVELSTKIKGYPEKDPVKCSGQGPSVFFAIMTYITFWFLQLLYRGTDLFFSDATYQERDLTFDNPMKEDNLVVTKIHTLRLEAETVQRCLKACREHQTSFTSFLHTLIKVTLAADFYPKAKFSHSETVVDVRPYLLPQERERIMSTAASMISSFDRLSDFRRAGQGSNPESGMAGGADLLWGLARKHKAYITKDLHYGKSWMKAWQGVDLIGKDEEDYISQFVPGLKLVQKYAFNVSNLGAFENRVDGGPWTISNLEFSAGAIKAGYGVNLSFNVSGLKGGATVIHVSSDGESLSSEFVASLIPRMESRMLAVI
ncbi:Alcohol acetyltransferase [Penicillium malachiteum]|uniref:Alcohol acetyltransferase n=1 Tax=Penicillium malachiteum TaxID=1324776 RepID=A0AAD6HJI5_9EURO|nr:Alcohol acetyltransferase [Penicillium malachiteum]